MFAGICVKVFLKKCNVFFVCLGICYELFFCKKSRVSYFFSVFLLYNVTIVEKPFSFYSVYGIKAPKRISTTLFCIKGELCSRVFRLFWYSWWLKITNGVFFSFFYSFLSNTLSFVRPPSASITIKQNPEIYQIN